jgi:hypothetical protein
MADHSEIRNVNSELCNETDITVQVHALISPIFGNVHRAVTVDSKLLS